MYAISRSANNEPVKSNFNTEQFIVKVSESAITYVNNSCCTTMSCYIGQSRSLSRAACQAKWLVNDEVNMNKLYYMKR